MKALKDAGKVYLIGLPILPEQARKQAEYLMQRMRLYER